MQASAPSPSEAPQKAQAGAATPPVQPSRTRLGHDDHSYWDNENLEIKVKRLGESLQQTRKKAKLLTEKTKRYSNKNETLQTVIGQLKARNLLSEEAEQKLEQFGALPHEIVNSWCSNAREQPRGRRYSAEMKKFAATLHYYSPHAYEYLRSMFPMPSTRSIREWLRVIGGWPGFTQEALVNLKLQHQHDSPRERLCSILLDGMSIKKACDLDAASGRLIGYVDLGHGQAPDDADDVPLATDALVFMVVGLAAPWKLPFGYFLNAGLSGEVLKNLLLEAIRCIQECGLTVVAVVCDCLGANVAMAKLLGCRVHVTTFEELEPCFPDPQNNGASIHLLFDACHGLKLLRNLLGDKGTLLSSTFPYSGPSTHSTPAIPLRRASRPHFGQAPLTVRGRRWRLQGGTSWAWH